MNNQENKLELTQKIHQLQIMGKELENLEQAENNYEAGNIVHLLKIMVELFGEVNQRLIALEKNHEQSKLY